MTMLVSPRVSRLFDVELRNDIDSTLRSAMSSIRQAPEDVLEAWCRDDCVDGLLEEVEILAKRYGADTYLWDNVTREPDYRAITPLEKLAECAE
jgi:hypothetical protein